MHRLVHPLASCMVGLVVEQLIDAVRRAWFFFVYQLVNEPLECTRIVQFKKRMLLSRYAEEIFSSSTREIYTYLAEAGKRGRKQIVDRDKFAFSPLHHPGLICRYISFFLSLFFLFKFKLYAYLFEQSLCQEREKEIWMARLCNEIPPWCPHLFDRKEILTSVS